MGLVDTEDTRLRKNEVEAQLYEKLYDPPQDGATPLDGAGQPRTSVIHKTDVEYKLGRGFTREPVLLAGACNEHPAGCPEGSHKAVGVNIAKK